MSASGVEVTDIITLFESLLTETPISNTSEFFLSGGTSLMAAFLLAETMSKYNVEITFTEFISNQTPAQLHAVINEKLSSRNTNRALPSGTHDDPDQEYDLSIAQESLSWFLSGFDGFAEEDNGIFNISHVWSIKGPLDLTSLNRSLNGLTSRHDALRAALFPKAGKLKQIFHAEKTIDIIHRQLDIGSPAEGATPEVIISRNTAAIAADSKQPLSWRKGEMLRCFVYKITEEFHVLQLVFSHMAYDFVSKEIVFKEISALYKDPAGSSLPPPVQYRDYLTWLAAYRQSSDYRQQISYWKEELANAVPSITIPSDRPREYQQDCDYYRQAGCSYQISPMLTTRLRTFSKQFGVTPFIVLQSVLFLTIRKLSGEQHVTVGTLLANRRTAELHNLCGFLATQVPVHWEWNAELTVKGLLEHLQGKLARAYDNQDASVIDVVGALGLQGNKRFHPLYQAVMIFYDTVFAPLELGEAQAQELFIPQDFMLAVNELMFMLTDTPETIVGILLFATDLYDPGTIENLLSVYTNILQSFVESGDQTIDSLLKKINP